jgi:hypothetical protein
MAATPCAICKPISARNPRLYEVLKSQGLQMNQLVVFLSDGGDTVRDLQTYLSPESEHLLDREKHLERVKWNLWHGNALQRIDDLDDGLEMLEENPANKKKLLKVIKEFRSHIEANQAFYRTMATATGMTRLLPRRSSNQP